MRSVTLVGVASVTDRPWRCRRRRYQLRDQVQLSARATQTPNETEDEEEVVEARRLALALAYVARRRALLEGLLSWCELAIAGVRKHGVWWWQ